MTTTTTRTDDHQSPTRTTNCDVNQQRPMMTNDRPRPQPTTRTTNGGGAGSSSIGGGGAQQQQQRDSSGGGSSGALCRARPSFIPLFCTRCNSIICLMPCI